MEARGLLIVWWSMTDGTRQLAQAAYDGALEALGQADPAVGANVPAGTGLDHAPRLLRADQAGPQDVLGAAGYLFCTPENLGSMAGMLKDFFDRCYYPVLDRVNGRPYASIVCAGSDGQGALRQIDRIATGWRLKRVADSLLVCTHAQTPEAILARKIIAPPDLASARALGGGLAAGLSMGVW